MLSMGIELFLRNRFGQVRMYLREVYGSGITITSIPKPQKNLMMTLKRMGKSGEHRGGEVARVGEVRGYSLEGGKRESQLTVEERLPP